MASEVSIKTEADLIDGTPDKRVYWSLISDYGLRTGLCELVDNAIDLWMLNERKADLRIQIELDVGRQLVVVEDNAGGIAAKDLPLLISPGGSRNAPDAPIIGVFGVGSKRASVAIGEHVEIKTRFKSGETRQIDVTTAWLETADWRIPSYLVPNIAANTTRVEILKLRRSFDGADIIRLKAHFAETYSWFIRQGCSIEVNGEMLTPIDFDAFAFPPDYLPQRATFTVPVPKLGDVQVMIEAGLIRDRDPEADNYGVYIYCNHRLIVKELQSRDVGYFVSREAGVPHPDASLARVLVTLDGPARAMPWNSSKSGIDPDHPLFRAIAPTIIQLNSYFTSLSRRLKNDWPDQVFKHATGNFADVPPTEPGEAPRFSLAPLPRVNKTKVEHLKDRNKAVLKDKPWTVGLVEAIVAADVVMKQRFDTRTRISLILLDSNFEIALKEFIVHEETLFPPRTYTETHLTNLFASRRTVIDAVKQAVPALQQVHIDKANHFYLMRNKLIHERATVSVTDNDVASYRETIEAVLKLLFKLKF
jgi:hypothetical protein